MLGSPGELGKVRAIFNDIAEIVFFQAESEAETCLFAKIYLLQLFDGEFDKNISIVSFASSPPSLRVRPFARRGCQFSAALQFCRGEELCVFRYFPFFCDSTLDICSFIWYN